MTWIQKFLAWIIVAIVFLCIGVAAGITCMITLNVGIVYIWTVFAIASMIALIKGYAEIPRQETTV